jgi:8-oxo-dGTP pyrophosphatase MutT (NUDIX family)
MSTPSWPGCLTTTRVSEDDVRTRLIEDVRRALIQAPGLDAEARFEQAAWLGLLDRHAGALLGRELAPAHLTASAAVLSPDAGHTCLVLHHKLQLWVQPGGHFELGDESATGAAAREVREETGLDGEVLPVPVLLSRHPAPCAPGVVDWHLDLQHVLVTERTQPRPSDETPQVAWWPVGELPDDLAGGVRELVERAVVALRAR